MLNYRKLETEMSLQMRGEVAMANNKAWMCKLWYFESASDPFVVELSPCVLPLVFAPTEKLNLPRTLYVLCRGITARKGMPLSKGSVWGVDFVLDDSSLADNVAASALTYTEVLTLSYQDLHAVLENENYNLERALTRKASVFYSIKARLRLKARELRGFSDDTGAESNGGKTGVGMLGRGAPEAGPPVPSTSFARLVKNEPQGGLLPPLKDGALGVGDVGAASQDIATLKVMIARVAEQQRLDKQSIDMKLQSIIAHLHAVHGMRGAQGH